MSNTVRLPKLPREKEFEELISSHFQCANYYIERNIVDRDIELTNIRLLTLIEEQVLCSLRDSLTNPKNNPK